MSHPGHSGPTVYRSRRSALGVVGAALAPLARGELTALRLLLDVLGFVALTVGAFQAPGWIGLLAGFGVAGVALMILSARIGP